MSSTRRRQPREVTFVESAGLLGLAVGLWITAANAARHHRFWRHPCPSIHSAAACLGHAESAAAMPYVTHALAGAAIAGVAAVALVLLWRGLRVAVTRT